MNFCSTIIIHNPNRVFVVLRNWVERLWNSSLIANNPDLVTKLQNFINEASQVMKNPAEQLTKSINKSV